MQQLLFVFQDNFVKNLNYLRLNLGTNLSSDLSFDKSELAEVFNQ